MALTQVAPTSDPPTPAKKTDTIEGKEAKRERTEDAVVVEESPKKRLRGGQFKAKVRLLYLKRRLLIRKHLYK